MLSISQDEDTGIPRNTMEHHGIPIGSRPGYGDEVLPAASFLGPSYLGVSSKTQVSWGWFWSCYTPCIRDTQT